MPFGVDLSSEAIGSLVQLMKRPTAAQRNQMSANEATAARQESSQQFQARQREVDYQRQTEEANIARNDRANAIFDRQQFATDVMERQHEQAMEVQRTRDATALQRAALSRRKVTAQPGGPMQPVRPASATLSSGRGVVQFSEEGGLTETRSSAPDSIVHQLHPPAGPKYPERFKSPASREMFDIYRQTGESGDLVRANAIARKDALQPAVLSEQLSKAHWRLSQAMKIERDDEVEGNPDGVAALKAQRAFLTQEVEDLTRLRDLVEQPNLRRSVTNFGGVAGPHRDEAEDDANKHGISEEDREAHVRNYLNATFGYSIR